MNVSQVPRRFHKIDLALIIASAALQASFILGYLIVTPAMRGMFRDFSVPLPFVTRIALDVKSLAIVTLTVVALLGGSVVSLRRGVRVRCWVMAGLSVFVTFAASSLLMYALYLPATRSVVSTETEQAGSPAQ